MIPLELIRIYSLKNLIFSPWIPNETGSLRSRSQILGVPVGPSLRKRRRRWLEEVEKWFCLFSNFIVSQGAHLAWLMSCDKKGLQQDRAKRCRLCLTRYGPNRPAADMEGNGEFNIWWFMKFFGEFFKIFENLMVDLTMNYCKSRSLWED